MAKVSLPDGSSIDFPDDTPIETINKATAAHWAKVGGQSQAQANPFMGKPLDELKSTYRGSKLFGASDDTRQRIMDAYVDKEAKEGRFGYALDDVIRQTAKGVPIIGGAADEINAGIAALTG